ncbi:MAG: hypothetical protein MI810_15910, partial [Flavobacteriales bacterium]|nr:hypothetical protein [Flavobacteriales bacterium]
MKILIVTDSHVLPTGLAETTRLLFDSLRKYHPDIYEIEQIGLFHCYAVCQPSWKIHPTKLIRGPGSQFTFDEGDKYGAKTYKKVLQSFSPDIVFGFGDPDRLLFLCTPAANRRHKVILYLNFDGFPVPKSMGDKLDHADKITVKSDFCYHIVRRYFPQIAGDKVHIVPSPADTDRFFKFSEQEKRELRQDVLPSWVPEKAFILGWVGRNQWRKQIWTLFAALSSIRKGRYDVCDACDHAVVPEDVMNHSQTDPQVALGD